MIVGWDDSPLGRKQVHRIYIFDLKKEVASNMADLRTDVTAVFRWVLGKLLMWVVSKCTQGPGLLESILLPL